ncbi:MAG: hypothetical protein QXU11_06515 [Thermoproteota archaeon]
MIRKSIVENTRLNPRGFKILLEILAKVNPETMAEVPYTFQPRRRGRSKLNLREIVSYAILLLRLRIGK